MSDPTLPKNRTMSDAEARDYIPLIEADVVRQWGKTWRRYFVQDVQKALVQAAIVRTVMSWPDSVSTTPEDIKAIVRVCLKHLFPEDS